MRLTEDKRKRREERLARMAMEWASRPATHEEARQFREPVFESVERDHRGRFAPRPAWRKS